MNERFNDLDDVRFLIRILRYGIPVEESSEEMFGQRLESFVPGVSPLSALTDNHSDVFRHSFHIFVLDQLREDLFQGWKVHQIAKAGDTVLRLDLAFINNDDLGADPLDDFEDVGDI